MAHDLHGNWEDPVGFNSPLTVYSRGNSVDDGLGLHTEAEEVEDTLSVEWEWEKLVLGLATYGRTFTLRDWHWSGVGTAALWDKTRSF